MNKPKFRAWDEEQGMYDVAVIDFENDYVKVHRNNNGYVGKGRIALDKVILMQYTGLKDKNGVEICEGDVVKVTVNNGFDFLENELCVVQLSEFFSGWICKDRKTGLEYRLFKSGYGYKYEVMGSIHANPELLSGVE